MKVHWLWGIVLLGNASGANMSRAVVTDYVAVTTHMSEDPDPYEF